MEEVSTAFITNQGLSFGVIMAVLGFIFYTSSRTKGFWAKFYHHVPALLLCYFLPGLLTTTGILSHESGDNIYYIASRYLLPASLILLTLSIDFDKIIGLGWKALAMFFTATLGVMLGGAFAIWLFHVIAPEWVAGDLWKGLATLAGSWIGGGANMASMKELHQVNDTLFGTMAVVDVIVAEFWLITLLFLAKKVDSVDRWLKADTSSIDDLIVTVEQYQRKNARILSLNDLIIILSIAFTIVGIGHIVGQYFSHYFEQYSWAQEYSLTSSFLWLVLTATIGGIVLSFTPLRDYEHAGASKIGSAFIYILVAAIGMHMDLTKIFTHWQVVLVGFVWILFHITLLFIVAKLIRAPLFFIAVGSKANIGGAASAPVVAAAFHPSLAPVGVLLAIVGYAVGTIGAYLTGEMMRMVVGG